MNDGRGLEFSICHSSTPDRFRQYETELSFVFDKIVNSLVKLRSLERECTVDMTDEVHITTKIEETKEIIFRTALELFYYWVNFAPLTRGTSATGYASLTTIILLVNWEILSPLPHLIQLDWEAILSPTVNAFIEKVTPMLVLNKIGNAVFDKYIHKKKEEEKIENIIKTLEHLYFALRPSLDDSV